MPSPFFASIFPLFPQKRLILRLRRDIQRDTPLFGRNGYVPLPELQDRIIVSWMKTGYTKEARLILQSEIHIFCYTTKLESKKQTVRQTTKKTNQQTNRKLWNHRWNRHKYIVKYSTTIRYLASPLLLTSACVIENSMIVVNRQIQGDILAGNQLLDNGFFK